MAPATSTAATAAHKLARVSRPLHVAGRRKPSDSPSPKKYRSITEIMEKAPYAVVNGADYSNTMCDQCGLGDRPEELILCDKCDKGFHMKCVRPIIVRIPIGSWLCPSCSSNRRVRNCKKRRRRAAPLVLQKKRRRLLPYVPTEDPARRLKQMGSLAEALSVLKMEFSDDLTYSPVMAPRSANKSKFENGGMQVLPKEDVETLEYSRAMYRRGECPPLMITYDSFEGFTVEADGPIKDMTFIAEYTGDVDYLKNREHDDCDSLMTLLLTKDPSKSLVICPDKRGNIARFVNGINNFTSSRATLSVLKREGRKKQNCKCVRYSVNGECKVILVATRDIAKGERLYYDYNGYEHEYPTHHFL